MDDKDDSSISKTKSGVISEFLLKQKYTLSPITNWYQFYTSLRFSFNMTEFDLLKIKYFWSVFNLLVSYEN